MENRQKWQDSVSRGLIWSSNINEGSDGPECLHIEELGDIWEHCQNGEPSEKALGINYEAAASRRFQISGHHGLNTRILAYGKIYRDHQQYNEHTLNLSAGYQFANAKRTVTLAPLWKWSGSGQYAQHRAEWNENRSRWSWNTEAEWKKQVYFNNDMKHNNNHLLSVFNTLSYGLRDNIVIFGGLDWLQRFSKEKIESYRQPIIRLGAAKQFAGGFDASFYTLLRHRSYKQENEFLSKRRRDNETNLHLKPRRRPLENSRHQTRTHAQTPPRQQQYQMAEQFQAK
nr:surface lipoprotein assembly modifier [Neisseria wadsworthii]